ncbi:stromal cell-derived factor 2-like [Gigantopelta aegis]|uniref:stromal cell-derived factor 2-like n=1 Tax=Gigantopelta aegis TaxID=1735272 RepID=UPI001B88C1FB|nr:stromal cell-derived factor 2-like [Gigantopelta aegis]
MASFVMERLHQVFSFLLFLGMLAQISTKEFQYDYVTCNSVLKLMNTHNRVRLHSHDVKYGSGSGQQSVTGVETSDDHNSYWHIRAKTGASCMRGVPIKCGQTIRLMHLSTRRNLHSHHFQSPLSRNLEVSAFGEEGEGDEGDNWVIVCPGQHWLRSEKVRIKNVVTGHYLHVSGDSFGRPIHGQREISGYPSPTEMNYWQAAEGIFIKPSPDPNTGKVPDVHQHQHTEL